MASLQYHIDIRRPIASAAVGASNHPTPQPPPCYVMGIMSGTSLDGIDLCVCEMSGVGSYAIKAVGEPWEQFRLRKVAAFRTVPFPTEGPYGALRSDLQRIMSCASSSNNTNTNGEGDHRNIAQLICRANFDWSRFVGSAVLAMVEEELIDHRDGGGSSTSSDKRRPFASLADAQQRLLIGSHGQTVWHENNRHSTLQIGDTEVLAHVTGMVVVGNFRTADVAVGGCGAPLVPYYDRLVAAMAMGSSGKGPDGEGDDCIAFQNLGGIGNVTFVQRPPSSSTSSAAADWYVRAFDTGPANVCLNEFIERCAVGCAAPPHNGDANSLREAIASVLGDAPSSYYDKDAAFSLLALEGERSDGNGNNASTTAPIIDALLDVWAGPEGGRFTSYFEQAPPKTAGREQFGAIFANHLWEGLMVPLLSLASSDDGGGEGNKDAFTGSAYGATILPSLSALPIVRAFGVICRALVSLTAMSVADAYANFLPSIPRRVIVSGGGKHHALIMAEIRARLEEHLMKRGCGDAGVPVSNNTVSLMSLNDLLFEGSTCSHPAMDGEGGQGIDADDAKEAIAFAVLAHERLNSYAIGAGEARTPLFSNMPPATGAQRAVVLGQVSVPF